MGFYITILIHELKKNLLDDKQIITLKSLYFSENNTIEQFPTVSHKFDKDPNRTAQN